MNDEIRLTGGGRTKVTHRDGVVYREGGPWSPTVISLLRHLEVSGFVEAPAVVGAGFDERGRETLSFIEGEFVHPAPWTDEAFPQLGMMLRRLHDATASFKPAENPIWRDWFGRELGEGAFVIGHCDTGPWNIICRSGLPVAFIDWEVAGPVRVDIELAQACWLNAQLYDDDIAERVGLGSATARARQVRLLLDGYGRSSKQREGFLEKLIMFAIHNAAEQAKEAAVTPETTDAEPLWAIAWRTRSASWMLRHRRTLEETLT
ncbi:aminoglycoside phosphotransferase family protein [Rhizobium sp. CBK13]|uniref:aminoglycoside phosphotransferase family protein n=1 Tax=Rhizobium sp. CBK13 TaxID=3031399 RepID=UPI0023B1E263|nr:aminoglycoside phosphotransferase family protein [Rhizobium sp. CBK13]MDE8762583.1 aminoglycoside phosphotransferase family protein [Rhizobium sp. CBK13]